MIGLYPSCYWVQSQVYAPLKLIIRGQFLLPHVVNSCSLMKPQIWLFLTSSGFPGLHGVCHMEVFFSVSRFPLNQILNNDILFILGLIALQSSGALFSHISLVCSFQYFEVESVYHLFVGGGVPFICKRIPRKICGDRLQLHFIHIYSSFAKHMFY